MLIIYSYNFFQRALGLTESTFFIGIRMFDCVLCSAYIHPSKYTLLGVTCLWIANKNFGVRRCIKVQINYNAYNFLHTFADPHISFFVSWKIHSPTNSFHGKTNSESITIQHISWGADLFFVLLFTPRKITK